jgi:hypothetical protein
LSRFWRAEVVETVVVKREKRAWGAMVRVVMWMWIRGVGKVRRVLNGAPRGIGINANGEGGGGGGERCRSS